MDKPEALKELLAKVEAGDARGKDFCIAPTCGWYAESENKAYRAYHGSLDAAKALHEAVLPGWEYGVTLNHEQPKGPCAYVARWGASEVGYDAWSANPARAWLIAILKALITQEQEGQNQ